MLIVDLNNFAMYPTASIGLIAAICRRAGQDVSVFSPLFIGIGGITREKPVSSLSLFKDRLNVWSAQTRFRAVRRARSWVGLNLRSQLSRSNRAVLRAFVQTVDRTQPKIVLISAYLMHRDLVEQIASVCAEREIPVLLGGPYFAQPLVNQEWVNIRGVTALAAGEVEMQIPEIVELLLRGEDPTVVPGMLTSNGTSGYRGTIAPPLQDLSGLPTPDFSDFPWELYARRIVPVVTGRGCAWGTCTFCSDVTSTAGRSYRSRPPREVLDEIRQQHERSGVDLFVFTDLKLNSNLEMWHSLIDEMQEAAPGARWIGSVHCGQNGENGLSRHELEAAANAGCVRLTTGLESGSQRMLDLMKKGTRVDRLGQFFRDAAEAGISARATMIVGYPGEAPEDISRSASFVEDHIGHIERIKLCNFSMVMGTDIDRQRVQDPTSIPVDDLVPNYSQALVDHHSRKSGLNGRDAARSRLLRAVHDVNRKPLLARARPFEGVM